MSCVLAIITVWMCACGGGGSTKNPTPTPAPAVSISISPSSASVQTGATQQFTATVSNTTNTAVAWQVNSVTGGNSTVGTISSSGLYTAPASVPNPATVTVSAISQADSSKTASASVTVTAPPSGISVSVSPTSVTLAANASQQFVAAVTGNSNTAVNWQVNGVTGGNSTFGTVSSTGLYTAPLSPPAEAITVSAVSQVDTTQSGSAQVTAQFGNASVNGSYVFLVTEQDNVNRTGFAFIGGTFTADGNGNITTGREDQNSSINGLVTNIPLTGTYSVAPNGQGTATIKGSGTSKFSFALTSNARAQVIEFDGQAVTTGFVQQQDTTQIASLNGTFVFSLFGDDGGPLSVVGQLQLSNGVITGTEDFNSIGTVVTNQALNGSYTVGTSGHGLASITDTSGTSQFAFYIINSKAIAFLDVDVSGAITAGTALAQDSTQFSDASVSSSVFLLSGLSLPSNDGFTVAGQFTPDGKGSLSSGVFDENDGGTFLQNTAFTGTYSLAATGRGIATVIASAGQSSFIFWMASPTIGFFMESDSSSVASGTLLAQQGGPFNNSSIAGNYAFALSGEPFTNVQRFAAVGQFTADGNGSFTGTEDLDQDPMLFPAVPVHGTYSIAANGRGTGVITAPTATNYAFYFASPHEVIFIATDPNDAFVGLAEQQCSDCH